MESHVWKAEPGKKKELLEYFIILFIIIELRHTMNWIISIIF